ncbi:MAG TPA: type II toxin-antitoxin system RelE/ParE family toxin [Longimicrobium sp.]|jgi:phage-related protein
MAGDFQAEWTSWFRKELRELPPDQQARVARRVRIFEQKGWNASAADLDIKRLDGEIWELRVHGKGPAYRILFFPDPENAQRVVVLVNCVKKALMKKSKVSRAEIERADSRRLEWLDNRKKES